jgi:pimeloyl-ACP methyl ester carboxylesterase
LRVPLDYTDPGGAALSIAVDRLPASDPKARIGSLVINPGGPGASGVDFARGAVSFFSVAIRSHFDIIGFDPRGVGRSEPVRCLGDTELDQFLSLPPSPVDAAQVSELVHAAQGLAAACLAHVGRPLLAHIGTPDVARDMDLLRAALGEAKLTYYGASYGTYLGTKYAELFTNHIRALVLDGALDPNTSAMSMGLVQAGGFETDLHDFLARCISDGYCPQGSVADADAEIQALMNRLSSGVTLPAPGAPGNRRLTAGTAFLGLVDALYWPSRWSALEHALQQARGGDGSLLLLLADDYAERSPNGQHSNLLQAYIAVTCIDRPNPRSLSAYVDAAPAAARQSPDFGAASVWEGLPCAYWPVPAVDTVHAVRATGAPPILVVGTTRDPATPYGWAVGLSRELASGVLLTFASDGHTAYGAHNGCVEAAVDHYLISATPPPVGTRCG